MRAAARPAQHDGVAALEQAALWQLWQGARICAGAPDDTVHDRSQQQPAGSVAVAGGVTTASRCHWRAAEPRTCIAKPLAVAGACSAEPAANRAVAQPGA